MTLTPPHATCRFQTIDLDIDVIQPDKLIAGCFESLLQGGAAMQAAMEELAFFGGCELYLREVRASSAPASWSAIREAAWARGEIAVGVLTEEEGLVLAPPRDYVHVPRRVVVLALQ